MSRYASQIDGEFLPVTGPCGERVYAKICRVERDVLVKRFDNKNAAYANGRLMFQIFFFFCYLIVWLIVHSSRIIMMMGVSWTV